MFGSGKAVTTAGVSEVPRGESTYAVPGSYSWTCPAGVTSVSVVCVGGGGSDGGGGGALAYKNNLAVTPGTSYTVVVGAGGMASPGVATQQGSGAGGQSYFKDTSTCYAGGGAKGNGGYGTTSGGTWTGDGGGNGGSGQYGGGGAGGYGGNGANATEYGGPGLNGSNGSGGAGYEGNRSAGGGVGIFGRGSSGTGSSGSGNTGTGATGGSGGGNAFRQVPSGNFSYAYAGPPPVFGAGGAYNSTSTYGGGAHGGQGVVRIIWPGLTRQFPTTDVSTP